MNNLPMLFKVSPQYKYGNANDKKYCSETVSVVYKKINQTYQINVSLTEGVKVSS